MIIKEIVYVFLKRRSDVVFIVRFVTGTQTSRSRARIVQVESKRKHIMITAAIDRSKINAKYNIEYLVICSKENLQNLYLLCPPYMK